MDVLHMARIRMAVQAPGSTMCNAHEKKELMAFPWSYQANQVSRFWDATVVSGHCAQQPKMALEGARRRAWSTFQAGPINGQAFPGLETKMAPL